VLIAATPDCRERPIGQSLQYVIAARWDAYAKHEVILTSAVLSMLVDRELEEGAARGLACHKIGHMGVQTVCIGKGELDAMGLDPARRFDLAAEELVKLH
jgi:hypothetical protein